jgi:hypothetical protein
MSVIVSEGAWHTLDAPIEKINVHVRGGTVMATQVILVLCLRLKKKKKKSNYVDMLFRFWLLMDAMTETVVDDGGDPKLSVHCACCC